MFCVECGKEKPIFREGSCLQCYLKTHKFTKGQKIIDLPICSHCNAYKYKNTWTLDILSDVLRRIIKKDFKISKKLKKVQIHTECKEEKERINCKVYINGKIDDVEITEEHQVYVRFKQTVCDVCSKQFGGYHEAIIQIRAEKRSLKKDEINEISTEIENQIQSLKSKGNRALFITDRGEEHGGIDYYISEKGVALSIVNNLHEKFGGEIKKSSKNIGMKDSKQVYRDTILLRLPSFKKNDIIKNKNKYFLITNVSKNNFQIIDFSNWDKQTIDYKQIKNYKKRTDEATIKDMIIVNQKNDEIQIMDEKTYKMVIIKKPIAMNFSSEKIRTISINDNLFLYPINIKKL